jgi:hypothetical protein
LRFIALPEADALIARALLQDSSPLVRSSAIQAATYRGPSATLLDALTSAVVSEKEPGLRTRLVASLAERMQMAPQLRSVIEKVAQNDPSENVRKAARSILAS